MPICLRIFASHEIHRPDPPDRRTHRTKPTADRLKEFPMV
jgi:hypothetical protein